MANLVEVEVRTAEELMYQINTASKAQFDSWWMGSTGGTYQINIMNDIDFNESPYYYYNNNFFNLYIDKAFSSETKLLINGNGHTVSNIYCFGEHSVFNFGSLAPSAVSSWLFVEIKNATFEIILNSSRLIYYNNASMGYNNNNPTTPSALFDSVIFNVKMYAVRSWSNSGSPTGDESYSPIYIYASSRNPYFRFVSCIFNMLLASKSWVENGSVDKTRNTIIMRARVNNNHNGTAYGYVDFIGCIFKFRNQTGAGLSFYTDGYSSNEKRIKAYNCAFFVNEFNRFPASDSQSFYIGHYSTSTYSQFDLNNTYFASFGNLDRGTNGRYRIKLYGICTSFANCFYDKNKIILNYNGTDDYNVVGVCAALTTEQSKDNDTLSSIGYIFCEES